MYDIKILRADQVNTVYSVYRMDHVINTINLESKSDHRSKFSNLSNWKEEAWKNQGFNGIRTRDLRAIAEVTGSNPVEALIFSGFFFPIA